MSFDDRKSSQQSDSSITTTTGNETSPSRKVKYVKNSGMVIGERLSEEPRQEIRIETWTEDTDSISTEIEEDESRSETGQEIIVPEECGASFGNIVVKSSTDVQFGNNIYYEYEGPVTIKQFVCRSENVNGVLSLENDGKENLGFQAEAVNHAKEESNKNNDNQVLNGIKQDKNNKTESSQGDRRWNYVYRNRKLLSFCVLIVTILIIFIVIFLSLSKKNKVFMPEWWEESNLSGKLKIIPRDDWLADPAKEKLVSLSLPVPNVIILCTSTDSCTNRGKCTELTRYAQRIHMKTRNWSDIAYNFLVGGDGYVYEGRGWNFKGAHAHRWNPISIGIGFIGGFVDVLPPEQQILAAKLLIEKGVNESYIAQDYKLYAHLQVSNTKSPGKALYEDMKTWPHWTNKSYVPL